MSPLSAVHSGAGVELITSITPTLFRPNNPPDPIACLMSIWHTNPCDRVWNHVHIHKYLFPSRRGCTASSRVTHPRSSFCPSRETLTGLMGRWAHCMISWALLTSASLGPYPSPSQTWTLFTHSQASYNSHLSHLNCVYQPRACWWYRRWWGWWTLQEFWALLFFFFRLFFNND